MSFVTLPKLPAHPYPWPVINPGLNVPRVVNSPPLARWRCWIRVTWPDDRVVQWKRYTSLLCVPVIPVSCYVTCMLAQVSRGYDWRHMLINSVDPRGLVFPVPSWIITRPGMPSSSFTLANFCWGRWEVTSKVNCSLLWLLSLGLLTALRALYSRHFTTAHSVVMLLLCSAATNEHQYTCLWVVLDQTPHCQNSWSHILVVSYRYYCIYVLCRYLGYMHVIINNIVCQ